MKHVICLILIPLCFGYKPCVAQEPTFSMGEKHFRVIAYKKNDNTVHSLSNTTTVVKNTTAYITTAFTPDNDGLNDFFEVKGINLLDFQIQVYNRWGEILFESKDINKKWDGSYLGQPVQEGVYVYVMNGRRRETNELISRSGTVTLIL